MTRPEDMNSESLLYAEMLAALPEVAPPAPLRDRVLARARADARFHEGLRTIRADEGWIVFAPGIEIKMLFRDEQAGTKSFLARLAPGVSMPEHDHGTSEECIVLEGEVTLGDITIRAGDYHLARGGAHHDTLTTRTGALLYLRAGYGEHVPEAGA